LYGDPDSFNQQYSPTPELTNIGSFEKCWRVDGGKWRIIKRGNELKRFSELFICRFGRALEFCMADYQTANGTVESPDFTDGALVNYEAAEGIVGENEDYCFNFNEFYKLSKPLAEQYLQIIYLDALCFNMDRHTKNYGVLRDTESGGILRMAPNFDNNIALFARGVPQSLDRVNDKLISFFLELLTNDGRAFEMAKRLPVPDRETIKRCAGQINVPVDIKLLDAFILNGAERIAEFFSSSFAQKLK